MSDRDTKPEKRRVNLWIGAELYAELEAEAAEIGVKVPALLKIAARAWCRPRHSGVSRATLRRSGENSTSVARDAPECRPGVAGDTSSPSHSPSSKREGREPPTSSSGGARPVGGLAARREGSGEREAGPSFLAKFQAVSTALLDGKLPDLAGADEQLIRAGIKRQAQGKPPVRGKQSRRFGHLYRTLAAAGLVDAQVESGRRQAAEAPPREGPRRRDGLPDRGHPDWDPTRISPSHGLPIGTAAEIRAWNEAKRREARKPNHSQPQERGEEDPMESEPISGVEEAERPSGRAEPSEANTGRDSEPQAAASREDGGAA